MKSNFKWNIYADQPHNVVPKKERIWYHLGHGGSYVSLAASNFSRAVPILSLFRDYRKKIYKNPVRIEKPFAVSVSPSSGRRDDVLEFLKETGIRKSLIRIPSWEREKLSFYQKFLEMLSKRHIEVTVALLQQRNDVLDPSRWQSFMEEVFVRFQGISSFFEIGHAWNRSKWGVWDYKEYLKLASPAVSLAEKYRIKLVGPAVIDFEFHLYPPVLKEIPFDKVSSLFYVDRIGAPENRQFGWDTPRKVALLKAVVDGSGLGKRDLWITEVNWPLKGTGKYSPASGRPNVSEEDQANYLVRYFILCLASGLVNRIYWWQLIAPGYGLVDNREKELRRRPSFYALKTLVAQLEGSTFTNKIIHPEAEIFSFRRSEKRFIVCWTNGPGFDLQLSGHVIQVLSRDGKEIPFQDVRIRVDGYPKYVFFKDLEEEKD